MRLSLGGSFAVSRWWLICAVATVALIGSFVSGATSSARPGRQHLPPDRTFREPYLANKRVPPPRELYSVPSVRALPLKKLWAYIKRSDGVALIGLKDREPRGYFRGVVLVTPKRASVIQKRLLARIPGVRSLERSESEPPTLSDGHALPAFGARVTSIGALDRLRRSRYVDYVEPKFFFLDSSACGMDPFTSTSAASVSLPDSTGDIVPYPFPLLGIPKAWGRSTSVLPGEGIRLALLDSGASPAQEQLNDRFPLFAFGITRHPFGRLTKQIRLLPSHLASTGVPLGDKCGHGTRMAGLAAAPKDGRNIVGVAWAAPMTTVKVEDGPVVGRGDVAAVCDGIARAMAAGSRVITMAFGFLYTSPTVAACIDDAYYSVRDPMFIAAAGTTTSWVVFPAVMPETVAASLVEISPSSSGPFRMFPNYGAVATVAYGDAVDFVIPVTRDWTPTTGFNSPDVVSLGGSSSATAVMGGLASLVWSQYPALSRASIINRLRSSASLAGITDSGGLSPYSGIGAGIPNAYIALGGTTQLTVEGPTEAAPGTSVHLTARPNSTDPLTYAWSTGSGIGASRVVTTGAVGTTTTVTVTATDPKDGNVLMATHTIVVTAAPQPTSVVQLWSVDVIHEYPVFLDGSQGDHVVNGGVLMPPGCVALDTTGVRIRWSASLAKYVADPSNPSVNTGSWGYRVWRDAGLPANNLQAKVHWWHDGVTDIRVRVQYTVLQPNGTDCSVAGKTQGTVV